jgi:hypothetical protein
MTDDIVDRLEQVENRLETLGSVAVDNDAEIESLEREVGGLRQDYDDRIAALERELEQVSQSLAFVANHGRVDWPSRRNGGNARDRAMTDPPARGGPTPHRWGIENGFEKVKTFLLGTTSPDAGYR